MSEHILESSRPGLGQLAKWQTLESLLTLPGARSAIGAQGKPVSWLIRRCEKKSGRKVYLSDRWKSNPIIIVSPWPGLCVVYWPRLVPELPAEGSVRSGSGHRDHRHFVMLLRVAETKILASSPSGTVFHYLPNHVLKSLRGLQLLNFPLVFKKSLGEIFRGATPRQRQSLRSGPASSRDTVMSYLKTDPAQGLGVRTM